MTEHFTFVRLIKEGRKVDEIATTFGMTDLMVEQRLALGNLLPKIQDAYRREEIDDDVPRSDAVRDPHALRHVPRREHHPGDIEAVADASFYVHGLRIVTEEDAHVRRPQRPVNAGDVF